MNDIHIKQYEVGSSAGLLNGVEHSLLRRVYLHRGVKSETELDTSLAGLLPYGLLRGIDQAVNLLYEALNNRSHILVVGDFDADGATSSALTLRALRAFGAEHVDYLVPNRFEYGYGLTPEIVEVAEARKPDLLITVDNGISSLEGVALARTKGISVLVTDHHLPGAKLPNANAIVNPNVPGCRFPSKCLAGVGVIFYVMLALRSHLREQHWFERNAITPPNMAQFLDLVALGTVADVVPLDSNNRILVEQGLRRIRAGRCIYGILSLLSIGGRNYQNVVAGDLGFVVGPRLNAAGRLEDMSVGIECLLTNNENTALELTSRLDMLNRVRRDIESQMQTEALIALEGFSPQVDSKEDVYGLCLYDSNWHQGVIGILAARIRESYHRPVIVFADGVNGELKGSARSVQGVHIRDVLADVASSNPGLIAKFGGHAMAAGLSLSVENLAVFDEVFNKVLRQTVSKDLLTANLYSDGQLENDEMDLSTAILLRNAGPWGQGFPEPVFDGVFEVVQHRIVGERHLKLVLRADSGQREIDAIAFNFDQMEWSEDTNRFHIAYRLDVNEFRGQQCAQLVVQHLRPVCQHD